MLFIIAYYKNNLRDTSRFKEQRNEEGLIRYPRRRHTRDGNTQDKHQVPHGFIIIPKDPP